MFTISIRANVINAYVNGMILFVAKTNFYVFLFISFGYGQQNGRTGQLMTMLFIFQRHNLNFITDHYFFLSYSLSLSIFKHKSSWIYALIFLI